MSTPPAPRHYVADTWADVSAAGWHVHISATYEGVVVHVRDENGERTTHGPINGWGLVGAGWRVAQDENLPDELVQVLLDLTTAELRALHTAEQQRDQGGLDL